MLLSGTLPNSNPSPSSFTIYQQVNAQIRRRVGESPTRGTLKSTTMGKSG